jgi:hypothetical protein
VSRWEKDFFFHADMSEQASSKFQIGSGLYSFGTTSCTIESFFEPPMIVGQMIVDFSGQQILPV